MSKITVKEVLLASAKMLGLDGATKYLDGTTQDAASKLEAEELLRCFNIVENEVALDYLPLHAETEIDSQTGVVYYTQLPSAIVRVLRVRDAWGNSVAFKLFPNYLKTQSGRVTISYTYAPAQKAIADNSDFAVQASVRLFAYGVAAEYTLSAGMFEDSAVWDKKYKDAIEAAYASRPSRVLRSRRWA